MTTNEPLNIGNLFPDNNSYYYRKELYSIDSKHKKVHFISYDVKHSIKITQVDYIMALSLTPLIKDSNNEYGDPGARDVISNFKRRFIVKNDVYYNKDVTVPKKQYKLECKSINMENYDNDNVVNNNPVILKKIFLISLGIFIIFILFYFATTKILRKK
jgi:hypothetical protein